MSPEAAAETHLEVYRPFKGGLRRRLGLVPVLALGLRVGFKRKLPLLLLYAVPTISTVVYSFIVYARYAAETGAGIGEGNALMDAFAKRALRNFEAREQIAAVLSVAQNFALLPAAWYGSGLIAGDLRAGALQLWFARPLGRSIYVLARLLTVGTFTALAVLVPGLVILVVATFNSPDYSFASDEGDLFWRVPLFSAIWITTTGLVALAVSSIARKRAWAMAGFFAVFLVPQACSLVLGELVDRDWFALGPVASLLRLSEVVLAADRRGLRFSSDLAWLCVGALCALSLAVVAWRVRRVEVIG